MKSCLLLLTSFFSTHALAADQALQTPAIDPISSAYAGKLMLGLGLIIALIFALAWVMKKMHLTQFSNNQLIRIVSAIPVGQRDRIALIQIGDEQIVVGLSPGHMRKLHTMKTRVEVDDADTSHTNGSFADKFSKLMQSDSKNRDGRK